MKANLMVACGTEAAMAASRATRDIPIVFTDVADPVGTGLVASLARPGANVTGLASAGGETVAKRVDLLREMVPRLSVIQVLWSGCPSRTRRCGRRSRPPANGSGPRSPQPWSLTRLTCSER